MAKTRRKIWSALCIGTTLVFSSCGDSGSNQDLGKMAVVAAGAGGGALLGNNMAGQGNKKMGMLLGGATGGALGYFLGNNIMGK
jgi:hypothetical protein